MTASADREMPYRAVTLTMVIRALAAGVPMIVVPISRDQPDNAARLVHHGVGITVSKRSSPEKFAAAVRGALADHAIRVRAREMAERLAPDLGAPKAVAALESLIASASTRRPAGQPVQR